MLPLHLSDKTTSSHAEDKNRQWLRPAGTGHTSKCVGGVLLFWEVLGWSVHQLPLLGAAAATAGVVAGVEDAAPVLASSPRSQIRHGVPDRAAQQRVMSCLAAATWSNE